MEKYLIIIFRVIILYVLMLLVFRVMGKREIGELSVLDLVVFIMMGEMAVVAIEQHTDPLWDTMFPIILLLFIQIGMSYFSMKSRKFRRLVDGKPSIIIRNGKINENEMKRLRYNFDDLLTQLRIKDISNIADVEFAILETSGDLSVIKKSKNKQPATYTLPLILEGEIQKEHLKEINQDESWLIKNLKKRGHHDISKISFCSFQDGQFFIDYLDPK